MSEVAKSMGDLFSAHVKKRTKGQGALLSGIRLMDTYIYHVYIAGSIDLILMPLDSGIKSN